MEILLKILLYALVIVFPVLAFLLAFAGLKERKKLNRSIKILAKDMSQARNELTGLERMAGRLNALAKQ